jgi:dihydroorotate dehydrogenase (NAD+) catalytic subunit
MTVINANNKNAPDLSVQLGPIKLANPVMTASGTCGYAMELRDFVDLKRLGGFITKSVTLDPRHGNPPQRTVETAAGMLNSIGLANVGLDVFCEEKIPLFEKLSVPVFVNVAGKTIDEYVAVSRKLTEFPQISGLELNVSCPNVKQGGITFGTDPEQIGKLVTAVRKTCPNTVLIVKLTPNVTDITVTARAAVESGADVLSLVNTFIGMAVNAETRRCILGARTGGLSGPAIKPLALYMVNRVYNNVAKSAGIPIIGLGGISCGQDALEFIIAGASAVCMGTAAMVDPACLTRTIDQITGYLARHNIHAVRDLIGSLQD